MDLNELKKYGSLMNELKLSAFEVSEGGKTIRMERNSGAPVSSPLQITEEPVAEVETSSSQLEIKSPMVGVFYSSSAEDKEDFVKVGTSFKKGDTICIIEAMKLMNEVKAEDDGVIEGVLLKSGDSVEFGTPMFLYKRA